ncbi:reverse transcriptase [Corchorus capsularis]|uniref:Reverse transcriptase n=1 Tax=Corchorus capsularis TaxID=210143 RepID=A0A1R3K3P3_COCAP|nr:reverse transcriptase [Corchorus capsularis]
MLQNDAGEWVFSQDLLRAMVTEYYKSLFSVDSSGELLRLVVPCPKLPWDQLPLLDEGVSLAEVKKALFQMKPWKAPGHDGFQAGFFQRFWETTSSALCQTVTAAFEEGILPNTLSETLLVLIPKVPNPEHLRQFRPISLCCVAYKLITKVLVNRIRLLLHDLVAPNQVSFIPRRQAADNIILAQEIIHTIRRCSSKNGLMAIKIDLEKAYDRVNWSFLRDTLRDFGFSEKWTRLIMLCVESSSLAVLWNGEKLDSFRPQRGLRQGDPLSPYLFVLCMERLGHLIDREVQSGAWKPIKAGRNCPGISHLFFADDLFLFSRAGEAQANKIKEVLDEFCAASGAKISFEKSKIFVSPKAHGSASRMSSLLGIPSTNDLGKYLGVPIIHGRVTKATFKEIVEKVQRKLSTWKSKLLSLAGRATLVGAVTSSIPTYHMMTMLMPKNVTSILDSMNNRFLWGGNEHKRGVHLVAWSDVCTPKSMGGLSLQRMELHNRALLQKTAWRFLMEPGSMWVRFLKAKYGIGDDIFRFLDNKPKGSPTWSSTWKGLARAFSFLSAGLKWRVGNGRTVRFWEDPWLLNVPLTHSLDPSFAIENPGVLVREYINPEGGWNMDKVFLDLPAEVALKDEADVDGGWAWLWKLPLPSRWLHFVWTVRRDRLLTNSMRAAWGVSFSPNCSLCNDGVESVVHVLRDCRYASIEWRIIFAVTLWRLWTRRCDFIMKSEDVSLEANPLISNIMDTAKEVMTALVDPKPAAATNFCVQWESPSDGTVKLNVDGAAKGNPGIAGAGGLIRSSTGAWLMGFKLHLGVCSNVEAELQAIRRGLQLVWDCGYRVLICESDALVAIDLVRNGDVMIHPLGCLIADIRSLLNREWRCTLQHIYREGNFCADWLANAACSLDEELELIANPPDDMRMLLDADARQRPRLRGDRSKRERLDDVFLPGLHWRAIPVRGREQDSKRAYLCSLLLHQARKFKDNCWSVAT